MKKMFVLLIVVFMYQSAGVSQACEGTPILIASAAYTSSYRIVAPANVSADAGSGIELVRVAGGCYCMGAAGGAGTGDATSVHQVCVDDYYMGKYEVTQAQWRAIMGSNPSTLSSCGDNCPVVDVSWHDAQEFSRRLSERTGKTFRLPTEAEWEYAVRMGRTQKINETANAASVDGRRELRPVGWSQPNGLGIYDMQGSVWEWTGDRFSKAYHRNSPQYNPEGPKAGSYRVLRGGSWDDAQQYDQATQRAQYEPWVKRPWVGFRLISPDQTGTAKYRLPEALAISQKTEKNSQCQMVQHALVQ